MSNIYAFPVSNDANNNGQEGMTLRDYFAGNALIGISQAVVSASLHNSAQTPPDDTVAKWAYLFADAMLEAREAKL